MMTTNEKIGDFIARVRQERGMTQSEFATRLGTSQSAVNRIEKGKQNLSLETLARLSDALNKQIISLGSGSVNLRIEGGHELSGNIPQVRWRQEHRGNKLNPTAIAHFKIVTERHQIHVVQLPREEHSKKYEAQRCTKGIFDHPIKTMFKKTRRRPKHRL